MSYQPFGDPEAIRSEAYDLKQTAEYLADLASKLDRRLAVMEFEGPYAKRLRESMTVRTSQAIRSAGDLGEFGNILLRQAAFVEQQNASVAQRG